MALFIAIIVYGDFTAQFWRDASFVLTSGDSQSGVSGHDY